MRSTYFFIFIFYYFFFSDPSTTAFFFFFFNGPGPPRVLHSSPTRPSPNPKKVKGKAPPIGQQIGREHLHRLASPEAKHPCSAERAQSIRRARGAIGTAENCKVERKHRRQPNDSRFKQKAEVGVIRNCGGSDVIRVRQRLVSHTQQRVPGVRDQEVQQQTPAREASG